MYLNFSFLSCQVHLQYTVSLQFAHPFPQKKLLQTDLPSNNCPYFSHWAFPLNPFLILASVSLIQPFLWILKNIVRSHTSVWHPYQHQNSNSASCTVDPLNPNRKVTSLLANDLTHLTSSGHFINLSCQFCSMTFPYLWKKYLISPPSPGTH